MRGKETQDAKAVQMLVDQGREPQDKLDGCRAMLGAFAIGFVFWGWILYLAL